MSPPGTVAFARGWTLIDVDDEGGHSQTVTARLARRYCLLEMRGGPSRSSRRPSPVRQCAPLVVREASIAQRPDAVGPGCSAQQTCLLVYNTRRV